ASVLTNPSPTMPVFLMQIGDLDTAQQATKTAKLAVSVRNQKRDVLWSSLESLCAQAQVLCDANPEMAPSYADMAGMKLAQRPNHPKPILDAFLTSTKGEVELRANLGLLIANARKTKGTRKTILWRHTLDGAKTWILDDPTGVVKTVIHGLPLGVEV